MLDDGIMNETTTNQWNEVGSLLNGLGLKLKLHAEQAAGEEKEIVSDAVRSLGDSLENAFEALRSAAKDPAIQADVRNVAQSLSGAVSSTLSGIGSDIRKSVAAKD
jgi:sensor histidine kinase regulating citrate/malate metabolism